MVWVAPQQAFNKEYKIQPKKKLNEDQGFFKKLIEKLNDLNDFKDQEIIKFISKKIKLLKKHNNLFKMITFN